MAGELPSNSQVYKFVARKDNLAVLEYCLAKTKAEFETLKQAKPKLSFGPFLTPSQAQTIFPEIAAEVQTQIGVQTDKNVGVSVYNPVQEVKKLLTLGVGTIATEAVAGGIYGIQPNEVTVGAGVALVTLLTGAIGIAGFMKHGFISYYNPERVRLEIGLRRTKHAYNEIAHEFTHHFHVTILAHTSYNEGASVFEGHAVTIARSVCATIAEKRDDPAYNYAAVEQAKGSLELAYLRACKDNKTEPKKSLVGKFNILDVAPMDMGYAAFSIVRELGGTNVDKAVFNPKQQRRLFR